MTVNILHLHSSFDLGGKEARAVRLMNVFGGAARHTIVSGVPGALGARAAIADGVAAVFPDDAPPLTGKPSAARYEALARYMRRFDLVLTYNWGALDAVMARRIHARDVPPLIHHEDGFNEDEALRLKPERNLFRRIALPAARTLVVPSHTLEDIAFKVWKQPASRVRRIANGVDVARYAALPDTRAIPDFVKGKVDVVIGTIAGLRPVKNLPRLVRAFAHLPMNARLIIAGEGPERASILAEAKALRVADRVHLPGFLPNPERYIGLFDIFALSSRSEQFPISVVEAMAAGLPVVAPDVGDVRRMVSTENAGHIARATDKVPLRQALATFHARPALRRSVGNANRAKALGEFDESQMIAAYVSLYESALGRHGALAG